MNEDNKKELKESLNGICQLLYEMILSYDVEGYDIKDCLKLIVMFNTSCSINLFKDKESSQKFNNEINELSNKLIEEYYNDLTGGKKMVK